MDNLTLTFLQGLADLLGYLPQVEQADPTRGQSNRGGITSSRTQRQGQRTSSRNRAQRAGRSTATVTSDATTRPGAIVRSPRGQLATTQPPGALAQRPSSALTTRMQGPSSAYSPDPFAGSATVPPSQGSGTPSSRAIAPGAQPQQYGRAAGPFDRNLTRGLSPASRNAVPQSAGGGANRMGPLSGLVELAGGMLADELIGKPLAQLLYGAAAQQPGTAASMGLVGEDGGIYQSGPLTRFSEPIGPQPTAAGNAARQQQTQPVAAAQPPASVGAAPIAPEPIATLEQPKARDWRDTMYMEAREKAMNIADPTQRQIALEGVAQMGMEFHKDFYGKS